MKIKDTKICEEYHNSLFKNPKETLLSGTIVETKNYLIKLITKLSKKYDIYFITEGIDIEEIENDFKRKIKFKVTNNKEIINPYKSLYIKITHPKDITKALKYWCNSTPEQRTFILTNKTKINTILEIYANTKLLIQTVPTCYLEDEDGFVILYNQNQSY